MFFPMGMTINDNDFVLASSGEGASGTSLKVPYNETYFVNSKVASRDSIGVYSIKRSGSIKVLYSASGYSNTDTTAYSGKSRIDKGVVNEDGTVTWTTIGAEITSARIAKSAVSAEIEAGNKLRIVTRNSASMRGGYSWAVAFVPNTPSSQNDD